MSTAHVLAAFYARVTSNFSGKSQILARIENPSIVCYITYVNYNLYIFRQSFRKHRCQNLDFFKIKDKYARFKVQTQPTCPIAMQV